MSIKKDDASTVISRIMHAEVHMRSLQCIYISIFISP